MGMELKAICSGQSDGQNMLAAHQNKINVINSYTVSYVRPTHIRTINILLHPCH